MPLVTISEGIDMSDPKRHRLVNPLHIAGYGMEAETFNDQVEACVYERIPPVAHAASQWYNFAKHWTNASSQRPNQFWE